MGAGTQRTGSPDLGSYRRPDRSRRAGGRRRQELPAIADPDQQGASDRDRRPTGGLQSGLHPDPDAPTGLNRKPFWFVSLSDPIGSATHPQGFTRLVIVQIDANTGKVEDVNNERATRPSPAKRKSQEDKTTPAKVQP